MSKLTAAGICARRTRPTVDGAAPTARQTVTRTRGGRPRRKLELFKTASFCPVSAPGTLPMRRPRVREKMPQTNAPAKIGGAAGCSYPEGSDGRRGQLGELLELASAIAESVRRYTHPVEQ